MLRLSSSSFLSSSLKIFRTFCSYTSILQTQRPKQLPIDITNYSDLLDPSNNYAFADKTLFIKEVIAKKQNYLILRPQGWGKTLNLSMLKTFFSIDNKDNTIVSDAFRKLKIGGEEDGLFLNKYGFSRPVIHLNLEISYNSDSTLINLFDGFTTAISECYREHSYLIDSPNLEPEDKYYIKSVCEESIDKMRDENQETIIRSSLRKLSEFLNKHHNSESLILIDNYDVPAHIAMMGGFYSETIKIMQEFFDNTLSNNDNLFKAIIMGVIPITKAYLFSSVKVIESATLINESFENHYGLNESEVKNILMHFSDDPSVDLFEQIYMNFKGYYSHKLQRKALYNPCSIINFISTKELSSHEIKRQNQRELDLIYYLYVQSLAHDFQDIHALTNGVFRFVERNVHWHIIDKVKSHPKRLGLFYNPVKLWSILFFTGYVTLVDKPQKLATHYLCKLQIPNQEATTMLKNLSTRSSQEKFFLLRNIKDDLRTKNLKKFFQNIVHAINRRMFWSEFPRWKFEKERHYHDLIEVILEQMGSGEFDVISEEKSGIGRVDMILIPKITSAMKHAYIFEFKFTDQDYKIRKMIAKALVQVDEKEYISRLMSQEHVEEVIIAGVVGTDKRSIFFSSTVVKK